MPRFNFNSYIRKNSLTDFGSIHDLDPQSDWEDKHNKQSAKPSQDSSEMEFLVSRASTTSTEVDRRLVSEINAITGCEYTLADLGLSEQTQGVEYTADVDMSGSFQKEKAFQALDNIKVENVQENEMYPEENATKAIKTETETETANESHNSQPNSPKTTAGPRYRSLSTPPTTKGFKDSSLTSPVASGSRQSYVSRKSMEVADVPKTDNQGSQVPKPEVKSYYTGNPNQEASALMFIDANHCLHSVHHSNEIRGILRVGRSEVLPPIPESIEDAITRIQKIPIEQVAHLTHLGDFIRHLQANEKICDVIIHIGTEKYFAHRIALACFSDYFADIFFSRNDKQRVPLTIRLKGIKPIAFEILLKFIYTGILDVAPEVVGNLMTMAESLRIPLVKTGVKEYVEGLPLAQALSTLIKEKIHGQLYDRTMVAICEEFNSFRLEQVFLEIDIDTVCFILESDHLNICSELDVFKAAIRWIAHNMINRKQHLVRLMRCVRFPLMTQPELFMCNELTDLLKFNNDCIEMLLEANWLISTRMLCKEDPFNLSIPRPRIASFPRPLQEDDVFYSATGFPSVECELNTSAASPRQMPRPTIMVTGGFNPQNSRSAIMAKSIEMYNFQQNEWDHFSDLPEPRLHFAVVAVEDKIYFTGGIDPRKKVKHPVPTPDAFVFNTKSGTWIQIMQLNAARMHHSMAVCFGMIYVVGGQDNQRVLDTVECYNPLTDNWCYVNSMSGPRYGAGISVLNGKIYIAGGCNENTSQTSGKIVLDSMECFDPKTNTWSMSNKLSFPRCYANMVAINNKLFLCGGATRSFTTQDSVIISTSSIDAYDLRRGVWEHCTDLVAPRHDAGVASIGNLIYIMGGASTQSNRVLRSVECYNTASNEWIRGVRDLPYPSKWIKCAAVTLN